MPKVMKAILVINKVNKELIDEYALCNPLILRKPVPEFQSERTWTETAIMLAWEAQQSQLPRGRKQQPFRKVVNFYDSGYGALRNLTSTYGEVCIAASYLSGLKFKLHIVPTNYEPRRDKNFIITITIVGDKNAKQA